MKSKLIVLTAIILALSLSSCFLLPQDVSVNETKDFITEFEEDINGNAQDIEGENTQVAMAAAGDFFGKTGTVDNYLLPFSFIDKDRDAKLLLDSLYGTYELDSTTTDSIYWYYEWTLTDDTYPANGYLYKWSFVDTSDNSVHDAELLFDSITYYSGDADEDTPTNLYISMSVDNSELLHIHYDASYVTEQDSMGNDNFVPESMSVSWGIVDEYEITVSYEGHTEDDPDDGYILVIDQSSLRIEDQINDEWIEYTISSNADETGNLIVEYDTGWKFDIDTDVAETVMGDYYGSQIEYTKIPFTGDLTKDGNHAADLEGIIWDPNNPANASYQSYMTATFVDGTEETIDIEQVLPVQ